MRKTILIAGALAPLALCGVASAETTGKNSRLPRLEDVKPLTGIGHGSRGPDAGFFHDFELSTDVGVGWTRHKAGPPAQLRQKSVGTSLGISFRMGEMGFAQVTGNFSREMIKSQIVAFPAAGITADAYNRGVDAVIGFAPVPYLRAGLTGGFGSASADYTYTMFGGNEDSTSDASRFGGFVGASYLAGPVLINADLSYLRVLNKQNYGVTNWPAVASWDSDLMTLALGARYFVMPKLELNGTFSLHHVMKQTVAPSDKPNDRNWLSLQLGATYAVTDQVSVDLKGTTWLGNSKFDYNRVSVGLSYRF